MNENILKIILRNEKLFVPLIFTEKQLNTLRRYHNRIKLSNAEKKALYTSIKKKMEALDSFSMEQRDKEYFINSAAKIIPARLAEAKKIINVYSKRYNKVFIAGSFLFSKGFNDIDVFIVREKGYKEKWEENKHIIFLTEKRMESPVFQSAAKISVASFPIRNKAYKRSIKLSELISSYHESAIEIMDRQDREMTRFIVFNYTLFVKNRLIDGKELREATNSITLQALDEMVKKILKKLFSPTYLYVALHEYVKTLESTIKTEKNNEHLKRYKSVYEDVIYESRRNKAESA